jgi:hypothetical protein
MVQLEFYEIADRWAHSLRSIGPDGVHEMLSSVEGTPVDDFPASPPTQDVNLHQLPDGEAILSVGMAGNGHWSSSYSIENQNGRPVIKADLACLLKQFDSTSNKLGSTYQLGESAAAERVPGGVRVVVNNTDVMVVAHPDFATIELKEKQLLITPIAFSNSKAVATRWQFEVYDCSSAEQN